MVGIVDASRLYGWVGRYALLCDLKIKPLVPFPWRQRTLIVNDMEYGGDQWPGCGRSVRG